MAKSNLPDAYVQEEIEYNYLYLLGSTRTAIGQVSWTSTSSGFTYNTAGSAYDNQGQYGLMMLIQTTQATLINYLITASDFNAKADMSVVLNDMRVISMGGLI